MSMNTPTGGIIQTTAIKDFIELEDIDTQQYLLGINNIATGDGSKIKLEKILENSISTDTGNTLVIGSDNKLLNVEANTGVQAGTYAYPQNLVVNSKGKITSIISGSPASVPIATTLQAGIVKPDGITITVENDGTISSNISRNIGEIVPSTMPLTDAGLHLLDGTLLQYGSYSAFVDYIADLYDSGDCPDCFTTEANWQTAVSTYGVCGKFVYDSVSNTVRLPKYGNQIITKTSAISTASTVPVKGNGMALGLTDGNGHSYGIAVVNGQINADSSAYGKTLPQVRTTSYPTSTYVSGITTNGTNSGIVADISSIKNYPLDCYYYIVIATSTKTSIQVDIDEIATDLNSKADVDLSNVIPAISFATAMNTAGIRTVTETYQNGDSWYRIWSDRWCEQGGNTGTAMSTITLLKPFRDTNYTVLQSPGAVGGTQYHSITTRTTTSFSMTGTNTSHFWRAEGYIN